MKSKIFGLALFVATAVAVVLVPLRQSTGAIKQPSKTNSAQLQDSAAIEVVFVLDTTGSMSGLIQASKEKIWSIASSMAQAEQAPEIRMGLVAYRDRGDAYVTRVSDLSADLDTMFATLMDYQAEGGGDGPESVNKALYDAVHGIAWSQEQNAYQVIFLVGDAPPHMDYQDEAQYPQIIAEAKRRGIVINTIQAGSSSATSQQWQQIASLGTGEYFQVGHTGSAVAIATPFDEELAALSKELDDTRLYYGDKEKRAEKERKVAAAKKLHESASVESRARRATFNTSSSGAANLIGDNELVDDVASGRVDIEKLDRDALPAPMQAMAPEEQKQLIKETAESRQRLQREIRQLAQDRSDYLKKEVDARGGAKDSLDAKIYGAVKSQAAAKGFTYEAAAPAY